MREAGQESARRIGWGRRNRVPAYGSSTWPSTVRTAKPCGCGRRERFAGQFGGLPGHSEDTASE
jgi:hypothetical protein